MKPYVGAIATITAVCCVINAASGGVVFTDDFANGVVTNSTSEAGFWGTNLVVSAGNANAFSESGGTLTFTAGSTGANESSSSGASIRSAPTTDLSFFSTGLVFSVRGITFDDEGTAIPNGNMAFRFALLSDSGASAYLADDAVVMTVVANGSIRLGTKQNEPSANGIGTEVHTFTGLGAVGTYGFDLRIAPEADGAHQQYRLEVFTGADPVSAGIASGRLNMERAEWDDVSGAVRLQLRGMEFGASGDGHYFSTTVDEIVVASTGTLFSDGFEPYAEGDPASLDPPWTVTDVAFATNAAQSPVGVAGDAQGVTFDDSDNTGGPSATLSMTTPTQATVYVQFDYCSVGDVWNSGFQVRGPEGTGINLHMSGALGVDQVKVNQGSGFVNVGTTLARDTWYRFTLSVDPATTATDGFDMRIQALEPPLTDVTHTGLLFQNNLTVFDTLKMHFNSGPGNATGQFYVDNVLVTTDPDDLNYTVLYPQPTVFSFQ